MYNLRGVDQNQCAISQFLMAHYWRKPSAPLGAAINIALQSC